MSRTSLRKFITPGEAETPRRLTSPRTWPQLRKNQPDNNDRVGPVGGTLRGVMAGNCPKRHERANQNAERLHGAPTGSAMMNSPCVCCMSPDYNMKKVSRAEAIMDRLVSHHALSGEGRDWLTLSLDPFHDLDHPVAGYPDADTSKTLVSCYQYALDVSKPVNVSTATWDAHVFTMPFTGSTGSHVSYPGTTAPAVSKFVAQNPTVATDRSFLNVEINNSGGSLYPRSGAEEQAANRWSLHLPVSATIFDGTMTRVIGMAFEIIDTTAEVYKQGALTAYRMPQMPVDGGMYYEDLGNNLLGPMSHTVLYHSPPSTPAEAMLLGGTRQWDAQKGAYVVCTQNSVHNPLTMSGPKAGIVGAGNFRLAHASISAFAVEAHNAPPALSMVNPSPMVHIPFNTSGVMLTGLNAASTFRIKFKLYVESAPLPWQSDLVVLATPSAPYDPTTLEAYSKALTHVPVAVYASDNAMGDWFAGLADIVSKMALPVSTIAGSVFPFAPAIGSAVASISGAARDAVRGQKRDDFLTPKPVKGTSMNAVGVPTSKKLGGPVRKKSRKQRKAARAAAVKP